MPLEPVTTGFSSTWSTPGLTLAQIAAHVNAAHGGTAELMVRIPSVDPVLTKNLLDSGVRSIMYPFVQTKEEARLAVAATRYPPHGVRGVGGGNRANAYNRIKEYNARYAEEQCVVVQVESPLAMTAIREIGAVDGLDGIFIGPNDLAANMGLFGQPSAQPVRDAISKGLADIKVAGKAAGLLNFNPEEARARFAEGFNFIAVGSDGSLLIRRTEDLRAEFLA